MAVYLLELAVYSYAENHRRCLVRLLAVISKTWNWQLLCFYISHMADLRKAQNFSELGRVSDGIIWEYLHMLRHNGLIVC